MRTPVLAAFFLCILFYAVSGYVPCGQCCSVADSSAKKSEVCSGCMKKTVSEKDPKECKCLHSIDLSPFVLPVIEDGREEQKTVPMGCSPQTYTLDFYRSVQSVFCFNAYRPPPVYQESQVVFAVYMI